MGWGVNPPFNPPPSVPQPLSRRNPRLYVQKFEHARCTWEAPNGCPRYGKDVTLFPAVPQIQQRKSQENIYKDIFCGAMSWRTKFFLNLWNESQWLRTTYLKSCLPGVGTLKIEGFPWNSNSFTWKFGRIATKLLSHSETSNKWATKKTSKIPVYWLIATLKWGGDPLSLWMKVAEQSALIVYAQMQKTLWFMHLSKVLLAKTPSYFRSGIQWRWGMDLGWMLVFPRAKGRCQYHSLVWRKQESLKHAQVLRQN